MSIQIGFDEILQHELDIKVWLTMNHESSTNEVEVSECLKSECLHNDVVAPFICEMLVKSLSVLNVSNVDIINLQNWSIEIAKLIACRVKSED